ncbi:hypothetical protein ACIB24_05470 [Spongisporangium articulatum]|uniref:Uncharacterized protein n=1 Tax=Spongisporangium articulatum TaxID=3362603 RepID=A0ABW8ALJ6_9ACTN
MSAYPLTAHSPVGRRRLRLLVGLALAFAVFLGVGAPQVAQAAPVPAAALAPSITIKPTQTLAQVQAAVKALAKGQSIELIDPATLKLDKGVACSVAVTVALYAFSGAVVGYLATAGIVVTVLGVAVDAGLLAGIAAGKIKWPAVYAWVGANVCK